MLCSARPVVRLAIRAVAGRLTRGTLSAVFRDFSGARNGRTFSCSAGILQSKTIPPGVRAIVQFTWTTTDSVPGRQARCVVPWTQNPGFAIHASGAWVINVTERML
jgi:hypothetical protein